MRGNQPAIKLLLSLLEHYAASPQTKIQLGELLAEDKEILAQYLHEDAEQIIELPIQCTRSLKMTNDSRTFTQLCYGGDLQRSLSTKSSRPSRPARGYGAHVAY